jgi:hypothetical protein
VRSPLTASRVPFAVQIALFALLWLARRTSLVSFASLGVLASLGLLREGIAWGDEPAGRENEAATESSDPAVAASALFKLAEVEDARGDFGHAAAHYRATVAKLPSFRYAAKAVTRAAVLEAHAEGDWVPYARLEAVRRDPRASSDPDAIDALSAAADAFPPGPTRSEAWMVCAEAYVSRLGRRSDGETALGKVIDDPRADGLLRRQAATQLVTAQIDDGNLTQARTTVRALGKLVDRSIENRVTELIRRHRVHVASIATLTLFTVLTVIAIGRAARQGATGAVVGALKKTLPLGIGFAAYVALGGGALAAGYEAGNAEPFFVFGVVLVPIAIAARAWGAAGSTARAARAARAIVSGGAVVAAAFLTLEAINGQYLEGFGL